MSLSERDERAVWHPYSPLKGGEPPLPIARAEGAYLIDESGRRILDGISSWWVNLHGHAHPYLAERVAAQAKLLEHVIFAGFTHEGAVVLAERLLDRLPGKSARIFYSDDGSTAVEVAIKLALQYWQLRGAPRRRLVALAGAYHGDTFGAMAVSERGVFTAPFQHHMFDTHFIEVPRAGNLVRVRAELTRELEKGDVAAFIFEPLVQGVAGFQMYPADCLDALVEVCRAHGTLTIADEVMTGFFRTGRMFASEALREPPDLICLAKGLTGEMLPLAATACSPRVVEPFASADRLKTFFHGHSYTANPLACAAALASLDLLAQPDCQARVAMIAKRQLAARDRLAAHARVAEARALGTILALEIAVPEGRSGYLNNIGQSLARYYLERDILLRPLGNVVYVLPPYCISENDLARIHSVIEESLAVL